MNNIPISKLTDTFGRVQLHKNIGDIILRFSTNPLPIGSVAYKDLIYSNTIKVADLGCGYGRCISNFRNIVPNGSKYTGIDPLKSNKAPFLEKAARAGFKGTYIRGKVESLAKFPDEHFDLILCNYSLYFFINELPLITSKLKPDGLLITITHSNKSLNELLDDLQIVLKLDHKPNWNELGSEQILDNFNAENGKELLTPYFKSIKKIEYKNNLLFKKDHIDTLFELLDFKKTTLIHHNDFADFIKTSAFNERLRKMIIQKMEYNGEYILNKDDTIYQCREPLRLR